MTQVRADIEETMEKTRYKHPEGAPAPKPSPSRYPTAVSSPTLPRRVAEVLPDGVHVLQSFAYDHVGNPGINRTYPVAQSDDGSYYERIVRVYNWINYDGDTSSSHGCGGIAGQAAAIQGVRNNPRWE